jgi:hypothetical protein
VGARQPIRSRVASRELFSELLAIERGTTAQLESIRGVRSLRQRNEPALAGHSLRVGVVQSIQSEALAEAELEALMTPGAVPVFFKNL